MCSVLVTITARLTFRPSADNEIILGYGTLAIAVALAALAYLADLQGTPAEYKAGLQRAIEKGWLELHESGT